MHELAIVTLGNEMDLILAHKRSMKLAELAGLSLSSQTTFATAVSEVSRNTIESGKTGSLVLSVDCDSREKYIVAALKNKMVNHQKTREGFENAKKLVNKYHISTSDNETIIELYFYIAPAFKIDIHKLDEWRSLFRNELPISPYDELKRKNEQLQDLAEKLQKSEVEYKTLTNSLPLIIFSLDSNGMLLYANEWLLRYTGETIEKLNNSRWKNVVHEEDYSSFSLLLNNEKVVGATSIKTQSRIKSFVTNEYLWHQVSLNPFKNEKDEVLYWIGFIVDIHAQKVFEETLRDNIELKNTQEKLKEYQATQEKYIIELNRSNLELQQFAYVASHDLQEPVRKLLFYSDFLITGYNQAIDEKGQKYLSTIHQSAQRMRSLIKDLLVFSQINKDVIRFKNVNLNEVVENARQIFELAIEQKNASLVTTKLPTIQGDARMMQQLFENIISNALKYAKTETPCIIEISGEEKEGEIKLKFKDNGIGFDEKYATQMFTLFQRLHNREKYEGTGLGLAICRKITDIHHGTISATSQEGVGSSFFVSLPLKQQTN